MGQLTRPHLPSTPAGCQKMSQVAQNQWSGEAGKGPKWAGFSYEMELTHRLTSQEQN